MITFAACVLAACGGHDFSKGDNVIVAQKLSVRHFGYCEGTVVSEKDNDVIVKISKCKNHGVQGADVGSMTAFDKSQVYKPEDGLPMVQARAKLSTSNFMNHILNTGNWLDGMLSPNAYRQVYTSNLDELIKSAKLGKLPVTHQWLLAMKPALSVVRQPEFDYGKKHPKITNDPVWNQFIEFMNSEPELVQDFAKAVQDHSNNAQLENLLGVNLYATIKTSVDSYSVIKFDPEHPEEWKKLQSKILKARKKMYASLSSIFTKYKLTTEDIRNDIKEKVEQKTNVDNVMAGFIKLYAMNLFEDKVATASDYKTLVASMKKQLSAQFPSNTDAAFKALDTNGKSIFERQKKIDKNFANLTKGNYWHVMYHHGYNDFDIQMKFKKTADGYQAKVNDTSNQSQFNTWPVTITPKKVTILSSQHLDGHDITISADEIKKGIFKRSLGSRYFPVVIVGARK